MFLYSKFLHCPMGDKMPDGGEIFLPAAMTKKQLYVLYLEDFKNQKPLKKKTQFYGENIFQRLKFQR